MGGEVQFSPDSVSSFSWPLGDLRGFAFEEEIIGQIDRDLAYDRDRIRITKTELTGDRGRDLIVESSVSFELFGVKVLLGARERVRVIAEIKSTDRTRLSLKDFSSSITQIRRGDCDHYFLITNSTITPRAYFDAAEKLSALGARFHLIDQFILAPALAQRSYHHIPVPQFQSPKISFVEYQVSKSFHNRQRIVTLDICLRNFSDRELLAKLTLQTDVGWTSEQSRLQRAISPGETVPIRFHAKSTSVAGVHDDVGVRVAFDQEQQEIRVRWKHTEESFVALHWGAANHMLVKDITDAIDRCTGLSSVVLTGEAGVGKTRILDEVQARREAPGIEFHTGNFQLQNQDSVFRQVARSLGEAHSHERSTGAPQPSEAVSTPEGFAGLVLTANLRKKLVLILEDAHHSSAESLRLLASLIRKGRRSGEGAVILIITGRNDHSFVNRDFFAFLDEIQANQAPTRASFMEVRTLSDEDTRNLIRHSIKDCPGAALEKIHRMSMNVPFNVVQIIMYLMDRNFADIVNRDTVGITNLGRLHLADKLPDSVHAILVSRISSLSETDHGSLILEFLYCASLYGFHVPRAVYDHFFDGCDLDAINDIMVQRRLMKLPSAESVSWYHENILTVVGELFAQSPEARNLAQEYLGQNILLDLLSPLDRGLLAAIAEVDHVALAYWEPILEQLRGLDNISTTDLDQSCYSYIPELMKVFGRIARPIPDRIQACLGYAYLGVHHLPLPSGAQACQMARSMLEQAVHEHSGTVPDEVSRVKFAESCLKQLEARARVNMGMLRTADFLMSEVRCGMHLDSRIGGDQTLLCEYHTTISDLYVCFNHIDLAKDHLTLLKEGADRLGNDNLRALHKIHFADLFRYQDPHKARSLAEEAHDFAKTKGSQRHATLSGLGVLENSLPLIRDDRDKLAQSVDLASAYLEECIGNNYSSSVPRAQKLLATLRYLMADTDEVHLSGALRHNGFALDAAVRYGDGLNIWRIYNDRAIFMKRAGEPQEIVRQMFGSAIEHMKSCGLLFLGRGDCQFPNLIVAANYLKYLLTMSEREAYRFFNSLDWTGRYGQLSSQDAAEMMRQAVRSHALLQTRTVPGILLDRVSNYALAC
jgi:hypothetical protein